MTRSRRVRGRARAVALALAALAGAYVLGASLGLGYPLERSLWLVRGSGYVGLGGLFLALSMTPAHRLGAWIAPSRFRRDQAVALRRAFGIGAALAALTHAALVATTYLRGVWMPWVTWPYLRAGLVALAILAALLATSFPKWVAPLRLQQWKALHRLAYVAVFFVFQHLMLSPFAPRSRTLALFALLAAVALLRLIPRRDPAPQKLGEQGPAAEV